MQLPNAIPNGLCRTISLNFYCRNPGLYCLLHELQHVDVTKNKIQDSRLRIAPYRGMYLLVFLHEKPVTDRGWAR